MTEAALKTKIVTFLNGCGRGIFAFRLPSGPFAMAGLPDILGVLPGGRFLAIEAKHPKFSKPAQHLTDAQTLVLGKLREKGALVIVASSLDHVTAALAAEGIL